MFNLPTLQIYAVLALCFSPISLGQNILLTNDDGWAVANIRAQYAALVDAGFNVVLSAPAHNESSAGNKSETPTTLQIPCEFDTCPVGSPAEGYNASEPTLNYVNAYPVDAVQYGIQTLAPQFFGGAAPDLVVGGPNVGGNPGTAYFDGVGEYGAVLEAIAEGIPAVAFSGESGSQVSYTALDTHPNAAYSIAARTYSTLTAHFVRVFLSGGAGPVLPEGVTLSVNYPVVTDCHNADQYLWAFARMHVNKTAVDIETCDNTTLPTASEVLATSGCWASVAVVNITTRLDVDADTQAIVYDRLQGLPFNCIPS